MAEPELRRRLTLPQGEGTLVTSPRPRQGSSRSDHMSTASTRTDAASPTPSSRAGSTPTNHNATAQIMDDGTGRSRFAWTVDVLPDELATPIGEMMEAGLDAIKDHLDQR